jgi:hypothetical protein
MHTGENTVKQTVCTHWFIHCMILSPLSTMKMKSIYLKNTTKAKLNKHTYKETYVKKCDRIQEFTCMSSN